MHKDQLVEEEVNRHVKMDLTSLVREIQINRKIYFIQIVSISDSNNIQSWQTEKQKPMYFEWIYLCMSMKKNLKEYTPTCLYWLIWE